MPKKSNDKQTQRLSRRQLRLIRPVGKKTLPGPEERAAEGSGNMPDQKQEIEEAIERSRSFYNESFATRMLRQINSRRETPLMGCDVTDEELKNPQASQPVEVRTITLRLRPGKPKAQARLRAIRTSRIKLQREDERLKNEEKTNGYTSARRNEIKDELENLRGLQYQECGAIEPPKDPLRRRSPARELGFETDAPSVHEILEAATIQQGLRLKKAHLIFAKLFEMNPERWDEVAKREAAQNPKIEPTRKRIDYGGIKAAAESKWSNADRVIAENYFTSQRLRNPLRELTVEKAVEELDKLGVEISAKAFERALRRLALMD